MNYPLVTVVIPARNEERYIASCLDNILNGQYPLDRLEVLVVDGASDDRTREIVNEFAAQYPCVALLENPSRTVPYAMNIGIKASSGQIIVRMDAHARYGKNYIALLVDWLDRLNADNVGGVWVTVPANDNPGAIAIAAILAHPFGVGNAQYRIGTVNSPCEVDTVPFGCYRRELFDRIGYYDEMLTRNQDDELNARLRLHGGRIFLIPQIQIEYIARDSLFKMAKMLFQYGYFKPLVAMKVGRPATIRQLVPPIFSAVVLALPIFAVLQPALWWLWVGAVGLHFAVNLTVSLALAQKKGLRTLPSLLIGFFMAHMAYGVGYLIGIWDFLLWRRHNKKSVEKVSLSR